ncbi:MAG: YdcF family protein [Azospirillaceae bacterium]|nr:YdcF family protein [Azospirillaceae bacterium]
MVFVISKVLWDLVAPGHILVILLLAGLILRRRVLIWTGTLGFTALAVLPIGSWAIAPLQDRFPPQEPGHIDGILVLGGSADELASAERGEPVLTGEVGRLTEALALARRHPEARLVFSGGSGRLVDSGTAEARVAAQVWARLGVDLGTVTFEDHSRNSYENMVMTRDLVQPKPGAVWVLVTSAFHMPRAMGIVRRIGWDVVPHATDYRTGTASLLPAVDLRNQLVLLSLASREWAGLIAYRLMDRTDALWPKP